MHIFSQLEFREIDNRGDKINETERIYAAKYLAYVYG